MSSSSLALFVANGTERPSSHRRTVLTLTLIALASSLRERPAFLRHSTIPDALGNQSLRALCPASLFTGQTSLLSDEHAPPSVSVSANPGRAEAEGVHSCTSTLALQPNPATGIALARLDIGSVSV